MYKILQSIFFKGNTDDVNFEGMAAFLNANKQQLTSQSLKTITTQSVPTNDLMLSSLLVTRKITDDLLVIKEGLLEVDTQDTTKINPKSFVPFDIAKLEQRIDGRVENIHYYYVEGYAVGIYLNNGNGEDDNNFSKYYNGKDRCVLFFSNESPNLAALYNSGESVNGGAIDVLVWLLSTV